MTRRAGRPTIDATMPTRPAASCHCIRVLSTVPVGAISEAAELHGEIPIAPYASVPRASPALLGEIRRSPSNARRQIKSIQVLEDVRQGSG